MLKESPSGFVRTVLEAKIPADLAAAGGEARCRLPGRIQGPHGPIGCRTREFNV